jgi:hypothetical protein
MDTFIRITRTYFIEWQNSSPLRFVDLPSEEIRGPNPDADEFNRIQRRRMLLPGARATAFGGQYFGHLCVQFTGSHALSHGLASFSTAVKFAPVLSATFSLPLGRRASPPESARIPVPVVCASAAAPLW